MFKNAESWVPPTGDCDSAGLEWGPGFGIFHQYLGDAAGGAHSLGSPHGALRGSGTQGPALGAHGQEHKPGAFTGSRKPHFSVSSWLTGPETWGSSPSLRWGSWIQAPLGSSDLPGVTCYLRGQIMGSDFLCLSELQKTTKLYD